MNNIIEHKFDLNLNSYESLNNHKSCLVWYTGLSGSGKSTLANSVSNELFKKNIHVSILDGDNIRSGINKDLTFSEDDRKENLRRIAEISKILLNSGLVINAAFISPSEEDRNIIKSIVGKEQIIEVYVSTPIEECERRDIKGLYKKARAGKIKNFTGISANYEIPKKPNISIDTSSISIKDATEIILNTILKKIK